MVLSFLFVIALPAVCLLRPAAESVDREEPSATRAVPEPAEAAERSPDEDFVRHVDRLRKKLPDDGFHILVERPFVVVGDQAPKVVERWAQGTIRWAVGELKRAYFSRDPEHIIDIWLFKNKESYRRHAKLLFGDEPTTPFGYYSAEHRALIMNISTGGGTLVHELVHPFIEANFSGCPAWFNEGLASLYEQCGSGDDGRIRGLTNWRLKGLQQAIRREEVPDFHTLTATSSYEFYEQDPGSNYAQARYLCYYLQERGLLEKYYHAFVTHHERDPSGYRTLKACLDTEDMEKFQQEWEAFVSGLRYP